MNLRTWTTEEVVRYAGTEATTDLERELLYRLLETLDLLSSARQTLDMHLQVLG